MGAFIKINKKKSNKQTVISEINITPLVDVMLVLLIVFMVTSPLMIASINVDLPDASAASPINEDNEPLSVTIDHLGNLYINDNITRIDDLSNKLKAITKEKLDSRIYVRSDKNVNYGKVIKIIGLINEAGYEKVSLVTEIGVDK